MTTPDGRYVLSYNGEVYNFRELRSELEAHGARFRSHGRHRGRPACARRLGSGRARRGSTACSRWRSGTAEERRLLLARDRYGIKPLYYLRLGDTFLFGSEVKAHARASGVSAWTSIARRWSSTSPSRTSSPVRPCSAACALLPAGTFMEVEPSGSESPGAFWDFTFEEPGQPGTEAEYLEELDRLFRQAVSRQLVADVPVGSYLSGGTDSGSDHGARGRRDRVAAHLHRRVRPALSLGPGARLRRARTRRASLVPAEDRALRDGAQVRRPRARHGAAGVASGGAAGRPELPELLRRSAGRRNS